MVSPAAALNNADCVSSWRDVGDQPSGQVSSMAAMGAIPADGADLGAAQEVEATIAPGAGEE